MSLICGTMQLSQISPGASTPSTSLSLPELGLVEDAGCALGLCASGVFGETCALGIGGGLVLALGA